MADPHDIIDLNEALYSEPFGGDETDVSVLSEKIVKFRKATTCQSCRSPVLPGTQGRARTERNYETRQIMTFRWCTICTTCMAIEPVDGMESGEQRIATDKRPYSSAAFRAFLNARIEEEGDDEGGEIAPLYRCMLMMLDKHEPADVPRD